MFFNNDITPSGFFISLQLESYLSSFCFYLSLVCWLQLALLEFSSSRSANFFTLKLIFCNFWKFCLDPLLFSAVYCDICLAAWFLALGRAGSLYDQRRPGSASVPPHHGVDSPVMSKPNGSAIDTRGLGDIYGSQGLYKAALYVLGEKTQLKVSCNLMVLTSVLQETIAAKTHDVMLIQRFIF